MKSKMKTNQELINDKLNERKFKSRIYSTREISQIIGLKNHPANNNGSLKSTLSNHPDWSFECGRSWMYIGNKKTNKVKTKPSIEHRNQQRRSISILWGLIKIR